MRCDLGSQVSASSRTSLAFVKKTLRIVASLLGIVGDS